MKRPVHDSRRRSTFDGRGRRDDGASEPRWSGRPSMAKRLRDERGSAAIEVVMLAPVVAALLLVIIFGGRVALTRQAVQAAAADAARAASLARAADAARSNATSIATVSLANQQISCARTAVIVDTSGFAKPPGTPADVRVTMVCDLAIGDLALPGLPGTFRIESDMISPLDTYRGRR